MTELKLHDGTIDDLIALLSTLPDDVRQHRALVFDGGSTTNKISIQQWSATHDDERPAVVIDCD